jgi:hypothetical protein
MTAEAISAGAENKFEQLPEKHGFNSRRWGLGLEAGQTQ